MPIDRSWRLALLWTVAVSALLLAPVPSLLGDLAPDELGRIPHDKLAHLMLFVPLTWAWLDAVVPARRFSIGALTIFAALLAWGGGLELLQRATGWRHAEWADLAADAAGIALAFFVPRWWPFSSARGRRRREASR